jgi:hypothetical protein
MVVLLLFCPYLFKCKTIIPYDLLYSFSPWESAQKITPQNAGMMDVIRQHIPWRIISQQAIRSGEIPFWNPYSSGGMPLMANGLSQVLYPPNILLLLFTNVDLAFTLSLFIHLWFTGCGMYLLLRKLDLGCPASLAGSLTWMLSGYLIVWLPWPPNIATIAWLPWSVLAADWLMRSGDSRAIAAVGLCIGMTILGGHLQYAYYSLLAVGFLVIVRLVALRKSPIRSLQRACQFALGALLGIMLSSVLLFSMYELSQIDTRGEIPIEMLTKGAIPTEHLLTLFLPNLFGDANSYTAYGNFPEFTGYVGITGIILCFTSLMHPHLFRRKGLVFFLLLGGISLHLAYGGWLNNIFAFLPGYAQFRGLQRFLCLWSFGAAGMVAYGVETIILCQGWRRRLMILSSIMLVVVGCSGLIGLDKVKTFMIQEADSIQWSDALWQKAMALIGITSLIILSIILFKKAERGISEKLAILLSALIAIDLFSFGKGYLPVIDPSLKYPYTGGIRFLISHADEGRIARFGEGVLESPLTPNIGAVYGLYDIDVYDSFSIERYNQLVGLIEPERYTHISLYNTLGNFQDPAFMTSPLLDLLGVRFLLSVNPIHDRDAHQIICNSTSGELLAGNEVGQTFRISQNGLYRVDISMATFARLNYGQIMIEVRKDSENGQVVAHQIVDVSTLGDNEYFVFTFPPIEDSGGRAFYIGVTSMDGEPGNAITLWLNEMDVYANGTAFSNKSPLRGDLCFRAYSVHAGDGWMIPYSGDDMLIYENREALPQAFFVSEVRAVDSDTEQLSLLSSSSFQPQREAVVYSMPDVSIDPNSNGTIHAFDRTMNRIKMEVQVESTGDGGSLLVIQQNYYPGWKAWVDGEEVDILQTDFAFQGITISNGYHHVELVYRPNGLGLELLLTFLAVIGILVALMLPAIMMRAKGKSRRQSEAGFSNHLENSG